MITSHKLISTTAPSSGVIVYPQETLLLIHGLTLSIELREKMLIRWKELESGLFIIIVLLVIVVTAFRGTLASTITKETFLYRAWNMWIVI